MKRLIIEVVEEKDFNHLVVYGSNLYIQNVCCLTWLNNDNS